MRKHLDSTSLSAMCGRYVTPELNVLKNHFDWSIDLNVSYEVSYNVVPSQNLPVVLEIEGESKLFLFRWGLIPSWSKDEKLGLKLNNARLETAAEKPSFRQAFKRRRCLVPCRGFYEWKRNEDSKQAFFFEQTGEEVFCFAGLWEKWQGPEDQKINSFCILTTESNSSVADIHHRMPVLIQKKDYKSWLNFNLQDPVEIGSIAKSAQEIAWNSYPVSSLVNSPRNNSPECMKPQA